MKTLLVFCYSLTSIYVHLSESFNPQISNLFAHQRRGTITIKSSSRLHLDSEDLGEDDWRDFRAKLVMQYRGDNPSSAMQTKQGNSGKAGAWAYESGKIIEKGSIILARPPCAMVETADSGLAQQYFHKSIILVLQVDPQFTKGIILNRPSNLVLSDDDFMNEDGTPLEMSDPDNRWKAWFGGEVAGILDEEPDIICLHSLSGEEADEVSETVMKGIKITNLNGARKLVTDGLASPQDFRTFIGHCGWESGQLQDELQNDIWYVVATDSLTVLDELKKNDAASELTDVGIESWKFLMTMIGRQDETSVDDDGFEDQMLREWTRTRLNFLSDSEADSLGQTSSMISSKAIKAGTVLRAASTKFNPFLLQDQEYYKSILVVIQEDESISVCVILNLPTSSSIEIEIADDEDDAENRIGFEMLERYGGRFNDISNDEDNNLIFLHCNDELKAEKIGHPVGKGKSEVWSIGTEEAVHAIAEGMARAEDFLVISGLSVWEKAPGGIAGGIEGEVNKGLFEIVDNADVPAIFDMLTEQKPMNLETLEENLELIHSVWTDAGPIIEEEGLDPSQDASEALMNLAFQRWIKAFLMFSNEDE
jgi:putative AlgH/UPF0301 family transcriptional regulator